LLIVLCMRGERTPTPRAVRPLSVVVLSPIFDDLASLGETAKPEDVHAFVFVAERAIEALQVAVLHRFARIPGLDEIEGDAVGIGPDIEGLAGELRAIIQRDLSGGAMPADQLLEQPHHPLARQRGLHLDCQTLAGDDIEHIEGAQRVRSGCAAGAQRVRSGCEIAARQRARPA
jgi:hypothetical protein